MMLMKKLTILFILTSLLALVGCAPRPTQTVATTETDASLAEASYAVSRSMTRLSETAQAAHPLPRLAPSPNPASYGMGGITSVDWSGPVEPLVREMAKVTGYHLRVLGKEPAIPLLVSVYSQNTMIADILRDVGYQCGRRATIAVYPDDRIIELRYARN
jgi:defect-in-organelle-trafficking protein DotD